MRTLASSATRAPIHPGARPGTLCRDRRWEGRPCGAPPPASLPGGHLGLGYGLESLFAQSPQQPAWACGSACSASRRRTRTALMALLFVTGVRVGGSALARCATRGDAIPLTDAAALLPLRVHRRCLRGAVLWWSRLAAVDAAPSRRRLRNVLYRARGVLDITATTGSAAGDSSPRPMSAPGERECPAGVGIHADGFLAARPCRACDRSHGAGAG